MEEPGLETAERVNPALRFPLIYNSFQLLICDSCNVINGNDLQHQNRAVQLQSRRPRIIWEHILKASAKQQQYIAKAWFYSNTLACRQPVRTGVGYIVNSMLTDSRNMRHMYDTARKRPKAADNNTNRSLVCNLYSILL